MSPAELTPELYDRYRSGRLEVSEMLAVSDLLAREPGLRATLEPLVPKELPVLLGEDPGHSEGAELTAYLDERMEEAERAEFELRLRESPRLRADLEDLRAFREELGRRQIIPLDPPRRRPGPLAFWAAAAAVVVLLGWGWSVLQAPIGPTFAQGWTVPVPANAPREFAGACEQLKRGTALVALLPRELMPEKTGQLMGPPSAGEAGPRVVSPVRTYVRGVRPVFRWEGWTGAQRYAIALQQEGNSDLIIGTTLPGEARSWSPGEDLVRGASYVWELTGHADGREPAQSPRPEEPMARFTVLSEVQLHALERVESLPGLTPAGRVVALVQAGLRDEAEAALEALTELSPERKAAERAALGR